VSRATPWPDDFRPAFAAPLYRDIARDCARRARSAPRESLRRHLDRSTARMMADYWRRLDQGVQ
jgi:hypothetical protein